MIDFQPKKFGVNNGLEILCFKLQNFEFEGVKFAKFKKVEITESFYY